MALAADTQALASIPGVPTCQGLCNSDLNTSSKWEKILCKLFHIPYCSLKLICNGKLLNVTESGKLDIITDIHAPLVE